MREAFFFRRRLLWGRGKNDAGGGRAVSGGSWPHAGAAVSTSYLTNKRESERRRREPSPGRLPVQEELSAPSMSSLRFSPTLRRKGCVEETGGLFSLRDSFFPLDLSASLIKYSRS